MSVESLLLPLKKYNCYNSILKLSKSLKNKEDIEILNELIKNLYNDLKIKIITNEKKDFINDMGFCQWGLLNINYPKGKFLLWFLIDKIILTKGQNQILLLYSKYFIIY